MTLTDALVYLGYEEADAHDSVVVANVSRILNTAMATLKGAVGDDLEEYLPDDPRAQELLCQYMDDLHSNTGTSVKVGNATRYMTHTLELQLRLELQRAREEGAANGISCDDSEAE